MWNAFKILTVAPQAALGYQLWVHHGLSALPSLQWNTVIIRNTVSPSLKFTSSFSFHSHCYHPYGWGKCWGANLWCSDLPMCGGSYSMTLCWTRGWDKDTPSVWFCPLLLPRAPSVQTLWAGCPLTRATNSTRYSLCSRWCFLGTMRVSSNPS